MIAIISTFIALLVFLFVFYYFTKDDLYFIRKGVSMEQLFNILLIGIIVSILTGRLFFMILNENHQVNNSVFSIFVSRPNGFSIFGGLLGLVLTYLILSKKRKISRKRFFDHASIALLASFIVIFLGVYPGIYLFMMYLTLFIFFIYYLIPKYIKGSLKPGSLTLITFIMIALVTFLQDIFLLYTSNILLSKESFLFLGIFFVSLFLLIRLEMKKTGK